MDWRALLSSGSVAIMAIALWGQLPLGLIEHRLLRHILPGLVMGLGAVATMLLPLHIAPGAIMDLRAPLLACAGLVGGPSAAAMAMGLALAYRVGMGGVGVSAGVASIVTSGMIGWLAYKRFDKRRAQIFDLPLLAGAVAVSVSLTVGLLPAPVLHQAIRVIGPSVLINFVFTWLFALSLQRDARHRMLIRTNEVYRAIIEALPDSLNAKDRDSRFIAANPATARLMRAGSVEDLIGKTDVDFYPSDMAQGFRAEECAVLANAKIGPIDQEVEFSDGSRRWLTTLKTPLLDRHGKVCGIITHNRDITTRKRLEADLQRTQTYLHEALTNMADGLVLYDAAGVILFCNQIYRDLFPATADLRVEGGRFEEIIRSSVMRGEETPKDDLESWITARRAALRTPGERLIELGDGRCIEARTITINGSDTLVVFSDITARKRLERDLLHRAVHDALTGLPNRAEFEFQIKAAHQWALARGCGLAVMMLDLDRFKQVNDTYGHAVGDRLLIEIAARLQSVVRSGDFVARLGGDEFVFFTVGPNIELATSRLAERVLATLAQPFLTDGVELVPGGSLGVAFLPRDSADPDRLLALADKALYDVKAKGGSRWASSVTAEAPACSQHRLAS